MSIFDFGPTLPKITTDEFGLPKRNFNIGYDLINNFNQEPFKTLRLSTYQECADKIDEIKPKYVFTSATIDNGIYKYVVSFEDGEGSYYVFCEDDQETQKNSTKFMQSIKPIYQKMTENEIPEVDGYLSLHHGIENILVYNIITSHRNNEDFIEKSYEDFMKIISDIEQEIVSIKINVGNDSNDIIITIKNRIYYTTLNNSNLDRFRNNPLITTKFKMKLGYESIGERIS